MGRWLIESGENAVHRALIALSMLLMAACAPGSGKGLDANGRPIGETPDPGNLPTLENIQARVFTPICIQCHIGAAAPRGLRLDSANAYNDLVGVASQEVGSLLRVDPFNPDDSYLVRKIEGSASVGGRMPLGGPPLPQDDILLIRQWIAEGAANASAASSDMARVQSVNVTGNVVRVLYTRELDANTVHAGSVRLTRLNGAPVPVFDVRVAPSSPELIVITLPEAASGNAYRLSLGTGETGQILDLTGAAVEPLEMELD
jgi:hypothetical protein